MKFAHVGEAQISLFPLACSQPGQATHLVLAAEALKESKILTCVDYDIFIKEGEN